MLHELTRPSNDLVEEGESGHEYLWVAIFVGSGRFCFMKTKSVSQRIREPRSTWSLDDVVWTGTEADGQTIRRRLT